jgi:hypothetical protein
MKIIAILSILIISACGAQAAQQDAVRTGYATELQLCIAQVDAGSKTKAQAWAEADACRAQVDARYGVDAGIGGAK